MYLLSESDLSSTESRPVSVARVSAMLDERAEPRALANKHVLFANWMEAYAR